MPSVSACSDNRGSECCSERQDRAPLPGSSCERFYARRRALAQQIGAHRFGNVLQCLRPEIGHSKFEPRLDLPVGVLGQAYTPRLADPFEPCGYVDAVAHQIAVAFLDDVTDMDPDTKLDAALRGQPGVA